MEKKYIIEEIELIIENELKQGKSYTQIARNLNRSTIYIGKVKSILVEKGRITDEEIEKAKRERKKNFLITDLRMQEIMKYIKLGVSQAEMARLLNCSESIIYTTIKNFKSYGLITQEEINRARQEYLQDLKGKDLKRKSVLEQLRGGKIKADFAPEIGISKTNATKIQKSLIEEGIITQTEIDEAVESKGKRTQKRKKVVELLKQGYTYREITQKVGYSYQIIADIKVNAISNGELTEEEIQQAKEERRIRVKRESKELPTENTQIEEQVRDLLLKGKDMRFIRIKTGQSNENIKHIIKKLIKKGKITQQEIDEARNTAAKEVEQKILMRTKKRIFSQENYRNV